MLFIISFVFSFVGCVLNPKWYILFKILLVIKCFWSYVVNIIGLCLIMLSWSHFPWNYIHKCWKYKFTYTTSWNIFLPSVHLLEFALKGFGRSLLVWILCEQHSDLLHTEQHAKSHFTILDFSSTILSWI